MKSKYLFSGEQKITAQLVSGDYIWLAFEGVSSLCALYKSSVFNPNTRYWDVDVIGDEITFLHEDATYLYASLDHTTYIGAKITKSFPSTIAYFTKDAGILEEAVDLVDDTTYIYFLTPGIISGENAKIAKYNKSTRAFVETIDLTTVFNAKKIDIDYHGVLWVQSELDSTPILTKAEYDGSWNITDYTLS
jgi:hypothetical protein